METRSQTYSGSPKCQRLERASPAHLGQVPTLYQQALDEEPRGEFQNTGGGGAGSRYSPSCPACCKDRDSRFHLNAAAGVLEAVASVEEWRCLGPHWTAMGQATSLAATRPGGAGACICHPWPRFCELNVSFPSQPSTSLSSLCSCSSPKSTFRDNLFHSMGIC